MSLRSLTCAALGAAAFIATPALAADVPYKAPRAVGGQPDLQGTWTNASLTTLERPAQYGDRLVLTPAEVAKVEGEDAKAVAAANAPTNPKLGIKDLPYDCGRGFTGVNCGYNASWVDPGTTVMRVHGEPRSSFITTPANGRVPSMKPDVQKAQTGRLIALLRAYNSAENPETRSLAEQCLTSFGNSAGPVMLPLLYNNNYEIVQSKDSIAILVEMVHDVRVIRLGGQHLPANLRPWYGDAIGHFEGDTLVVETTNFPEAMNFHGSAQNLKVIERFTRVAPNRLLYQFTVVDPTVWDQPWGGEYEFAATKGPVYEYACHEGNYALTDILSGARAEEQARAAKAAAPAPAAPASATTPAAPAKGTR
jgi:hypothetical protein